MMVLTMRERWSLVGREIRLGRVARNWSQTELAAQIGSTQMQVSRDERGPQKGIDTARLNQYARTLSLDYDKILAILHGPQGTDEADDFELIGKLKAVRAIPGLSDAERHEIEMFVRTHHLPSTPPPAPTSGQKGGATSRTA